MYNAYLTNTLKFYPDKCTGCGVCYDVCPHGVFEQTGHTVRMAHPRSCMECGACQMNCPFDAITVQSGTGCAVAMMRAAILRQNTATCG
jgi:ferredoxin